MNLGLISEPMEIDMDKSNSKQTSKDISITNDNNSISNNNSKSKRVRKKNNDTESVTSSKHQQTTGTTGKQGWRVVRNPCKKVQSTSTNQCVYAAEACHPYT